MKNNRRFYDPPAVERIEVPEQGSARRRWIAVAALLLLAALAFGLGLRRGTSRDAGWSTIEAEESSTGWAAEFTLRCALDEKDSTAQYRRLSARYTAAGERASRVYSEREYEGIGNLFTVNAHPNAVVTVEPELYEALALIQRYQNRVLYLAPLYETYNGLFTCTEDRETVDFDPLQNPELADIFREIAAYASDPAQIDLELLGENQVRLRVSDAYLDYAAANAVGRFVDLSWMKNAFILDDLGEALRAVGGTRGYLQSREGFGCNLDESGEEFALNVFDRGRLVARLIYDWPLRYVALRSYSLSPSLGDGYYELANGEVRSIYVDPADGMPKTAIDDLLLWSPTLGCGELLLRACPIFLAERFDALDLDARSLYDAYCEDQNLFCSDPAMRVPELAEGYTVLGKGEA